ncbi:MAG: DUF3293 domain-containing protein [Rhodanobacter sp.]
MDEALLREYRASTYLVCVNAGLWSPIRVGEGLPESLRTLIGNHGWGFITAWNPHSVQRAIAENTAAQQQLLATLRANGNLLALHPGVGIGAQGWYEPSLFVLGLDLDTLDQLGGKFAQNAYIYGRGTELACLREL